MKYVQCLTLVLQGIIHKYVIEQNATTFIPGAVVVLAGVTVFSPVEVFSVVMMAQPLLTMITG